MKRVTIGSTLATLLVICFIIIILSGEDCDFCFSAPVMAIKLFACGLVLFIGSLYFTKLFLKTEKQMFAIETLPLLKTDEATEDVPFSCEGTVRAIDGNLLSSPYTHSPCVYYHSITEEYVKSGKSSEWRIIDNLVNFVPFHITDKRGTLKVSLLNLDSDFSGYTLQSVKTYVPDPKNSEVDCIALIKHASYIPDAKKTGFFSHGRRMRRSEFILPPDTNVFAYGFISKWNKELVLHEDPQHPLIISRKTKDEYIEEFYKGASLIYFVHLLTALGFTIAILSLNYFTNLHPAILLPVLVLGNGIITGSVVFTMYNRLMTLKQRAINALSNIDIELKRRADLIPQLVALVKEYSRYEKEVQNLLVNLRSQKPDYSVLLAIIEKYPKMKADENFRSLMKNLVDTEERIAYSRSFYNRNVRKLNTLIWQFPFIIIASLFTIKHMDFITFPGDKTVPNTL